MSYWRKTIFDYGLSHLGKLKSIRYDIRDTIILSGSPRSGTTWLSEILNTIPRSCILWEPLNMDTIPYLNKLGFQWRTSISIGESRPSVESYLGGVLTGKKLNSHITSRANLGELFRCKHYIVKFCRAQRLFGWLADRFATRTPILLIRHPCAVIASQINLDIYPPGWKYTESRSKEDWAEAIATTWCEDYYDALSLPKPHPWILVTYERLVTQGQSEITRIFEALEIEMPEKAIHQLEVPSSMTQKGSSLEEEIPLATWTSRLSKGQIERILNVVSKYGLDFYSDALEPDYDRLNSFTASHDMSDKYK